jgi:hypothetical protein
MSSVSVPLSTRRVRSPLPPFVLLAVIAALIAVVGFGLWTASRANQLPGIAASEAAIQEKYGVRVAHIAVLADGGLIDFRFQVTDVDKASPLFELDTRPIMIVEATGHQVGGLYHPPHGHNIAAGQQAYFIYNNDHGAIQPGTSVSVLLGDLRLEHVIAQ